MKSVKNYKKLPSNIVFSSNTAPDNVKTEVELGEKTQIRANARAISVIFTDSDGQSTVYTSLKAAEAATGFKSSVIKNLASQNKEGWSIAL
jgi:hypothetical protein